MSGAWEERARAAAADVLAVAPASVRCSPLGVREGREVYVAEDGARAVVAKCYPDPGRAAAAAQALAALGGEHGPLLVPRALALDRERGVVVQTLLRGRPLLETLPGDDAIARLGAALAALHALGAPLPSRRPRDGELAAAEAALARLDGDDRGPAGAALARAREALTSAPPLDAVPSHGDLGLAQVLDCAPRIGIVDFDKAALAEPALDAGNLTAQLVRRRPGDGPELAAALVAAYEAAGGAPLGGRVRAYATVVLVRKLAWLPEARRAPVRAALSALS